MAPRTEPAASAEPMAPAFRVNEKRWHDEVDYGYLFLTLIDTVGIIEVPQILLRADNSGHT